MDETTGKPVLCPNAAGYGAGRENEGVWRAGDTDGEGAEGVYCGGNAVKYIDSIRKIEKNLEKIGEAFKECENIERSYHQNSTMRVKNDLATLALQSQNNALQMANRQNEIYRKIIDNIGKGLTNFAQFEQKKLFTNSSLGTMTKYVEFYQKACETATRGSWVQSFCQIQNLMENITEIQSKLETDAIKSADTLSQMMFSLAEYYNTFANNAAYLQISKILEVYQNSLENMIYTIQYLPQNEFEDLCQIGMNFDMEGVTLSEEGALSYQGITYEKDEVPQEFVRQTQKIKQEPISLKQHVEELRQKYWLLILVVSIYMFVPAFSDATQWYENKCNELKEIIFNFPQMCYTIKEKSYLRCEANAKSKILAILVYGTKIEILEDIPRWYKVKYIDETGAETEGWISKISVEE